MHRMRKGLVQAAISVAVLAGLSVGTANAADRSNIDRTKIAERRNGPCHVTVIRAENLHAVTITGLDPGEEFDLKLSYEGRVLVLPIVVANKGIVQVALESNVRGESIGVGYVDFDSSRCRIHMSYPWRSKT